MKLLIVGVLAAALSAGASGLDGKWNVDLAMAARNKKDAPKAAQVSFNLKSEDSKLTGSVLAAKGKKGRPMTIQNGAISGDHFTFSTVQSTKKGDTTWLWEGSVMGDQIKGTRSREGAKRSIAFTAKRQG